MRLDQAIKSKLPYRRKGAPFWLTPYEEDSRLSQVDTFSEVEVIAEDWEVKRSPIVLGGPPKNIGEYVDDALKGSYAKQVKITIEVIDE